METATDPPVTLESVDAKERKWYEFIGQLSADEKACLFDGATEQMLFDQYMQGDTSLQDVRLVLAFDAAGQDG